jgi:hypothetical protein
VPHEVRESYRGLLIAVAAAIWARYDRHGPAALARTLRTRAGHAYLRAFRKHPKPPATKRPKAYAPWEDVQRTVAPARLLDQHKRPQHLERGGSNDSMKLPRRCHTPTAALAPSVATSQLMRRR